MNYKLAKQLKDAGFPLKNSVWDKFLYIGKPLEEDFEREWNKGKETFSPTLSELIEACGDNEFFCLEKWKDKWTACALGFMTNAKTPKIAVAKLYLKINKPNKK